MDNNKKADCRAEALSLALIGNDARTAEHVVTRAKAFADFMIDGKAPVDDTKPKVAIVASTKKRK